MDIPKKMSFHHHLQDPGSHALLEALISLHKKLINAIIVLFISSAKAFRTSTLFFNGIFCSPVELQGRY
jgi:hypothetical protein